MICKTSTNKLAVAVVENKVKLSATAKKALEREVHLLYNEFNIIWTMLTKHNILKVVDLEYKLKNHEMLVTEEESNLLITRAPKNEIEKLWLKRFFSLTARRRNIQTMINKDNKIPLDVMISAAATYA